ncbi:MAG: tyrosine-type recombinase/integrase [Filomicrobium sp.]
MPKRLKLKYLQSVYRKGRWYHYVRRGKTQIRIHGETDSAQFAEEYAAARRLVEYDPKPLKAADGSVAWLAQSYLASDDFHSLAQRTQMSYRREIDRLKPISRFPIEDIKRRHLKAIKDTLQDKPRMARMFAQVCSILWRWGIRELDLEVENPARMMASKSSSKSFRPWTPEEQAQFEASNPPLWLMTAYKLAKYTGARRGDIVAIKGNDRQNGFIRVQGQKTGNEVWVPEHPELTAYLDALGAQFYLVSHAKGPFKPETVSRALRAHLVASGMPDDLVLHGLRHTAGKALAEAGCSPNEIAAVLGHKTLQMVQHYTKKAEQKRLSSAAIVKLTKS